MRCASIDIGTVTCRLLVADAEKAEMRPGSNSGEGADACREGAVLNELVHGYRICNLGEGVDATGVLKPEAMQRVADAIAEYQREIERLQPEDGTGIDVTVVATSASRDAKNAAEFRSLLARQGIELTVIPGEREAALSFLGATCDFVGERVVVVDIGGGSTEVVAGVAGGDPERARSFNIGCRRVTERFLHTDPPTAAEIEAARAWTEDEMKPYFDEMRACGQLPARIIAVAGTATSVVSIREQMEVYDSSRVHGAEVTREVLEDILQHLSSVPCEQRAQTVGLDPGRAPVIVAGLLILKTVLDLSGASTYTASEKDILQGIIFDKMLE